MIELIIVLGVVLAVGVTLLAMLVGVSEFLGMHDDGED